jgi:hypothetical protein
MATGKGARRIVGEAEGVTVTCVLECSKSGKPDRLWIHIRQQRGAKKWRLCRALAYARSADIQFVHAPEEDG